MIRSTTTLTVLLLTLGCQSAPQADHAPHGHHGHHGDHGHSHGASHGDHGHSHGDHSHALTTTSETRLGARQAPEVSADRLQAQVEEALEAHDFLRSIELLKALRTARPHDVQARLLLSDALVELGQIDAAEEELQTVLDLKPCAAVYLRAGYVLHLRGDTQAGVEVLDLAVECAGTAKTRAWALAERGDLLQHQGQIAGAGASYTQAALLDPKLGRARVGQAQIAASMGDLPRAVELLRAAASTPEHLSDLAAWEIAIGQLPEAVATLERARAMAQADAFHWGRQAAVALADHGWGKAWGVKLARQELQRRGNVHGWDALSWALLGAGHVQQAYRASRRALALGTEEPRLLFHAGMAASRAGHPHQATRLLGRALQLNPRFHVRFAVVARTELARLAAR
jgi:tetratricopeptide (TPR) repeat protein